MDYQYRIYKNPKEDTLNAVERVQSLYNEDPNKLYEAIRGGPGLYKYIPIGYRSEKLGIEIIQVCGYEFSKYEDMWISIFNSYRYNLLNFENQERRRKIREQLNKEFYKR